MSSRRTAEGRIGHCLTQSETLLECIERHFGVTSEDAEQLIAFGAVYLDRKRIAGNPALSEGRYVRVHFHSKRYPVDEIDWRASVVHRDEAFVVVNKPAGIPVHATLDNRIENVAHQMSLALGSPTFVTQRLDTDVSGLVVLARTRDFQTRFNRLLVDRKVRKRYRALVNTSPPLGRHIHYMEPTKRGPKKVVNESRPRWLECVLSVVHVTPAGDRFDVEIDLETGRTHQIRAQLSAIGSPIVGDALYGSDTLYALDLYALDGSAARGIALFSTAIAWLDEAGRGWSFELPPPW